MSLLSFEQDSNRAPESDERLLALSVHNPALFDELVVRYEAAFLRKVRQVVRTEEDAEDIVQDAFTKIYLHASDFEVQEGASFKSWGYKILLNTAFTHYQKLKKHGKATMPLSSELEAILPDKTLRQFEKVELADYVLSVFDRMSESFRRVLKLYFIEGKNQAEIAEIEGVSVGAIKTRMHRAKEEFRKVNSVVGN